MLIRSAALLFQTGDSAQTTKNFTVGVDMSFEPGQVNMAYRGTIEEWLHVARSQFAILGFALAILNQSDEGAEAAMRACGETDAGATGAKPGDEGRRLETQAGWPEECSWPALAACWHGWPRAPASG